MIDGVLARLAILIALGTLAILVYWLLRRWQVRRTAAFAPTDPLLSARRPGVPAIVYFTTPACVPCKTRQRPALHRLAADLGEGGVQIIEINALEQPDAADRWGVLSVPTTFVLDRQGRPRQINYGVAGVEKLKQQLQGL